MKNEGYRWLLTSVTGAVTSNQKINFDYGLKDCMRRSSPNLDIDRPRATFLLV